MTSQSSSGALSTPIRHYVDRDISDMLRRLDPVAGRVALGPGGFAWCAIRGVAGCMAA